MLQSHGSCVTIPVKDPALERFSVAERLQRRYGANPGI
jgi:hypothetical protein